MSETKITIENDSKDAEKSNISEQTGPNTTVHLHVNENEEKDVRRSVLHTKEEHETERNELGPQSKTSILVSNKERGVQGNYQKYIVLFGQDPLQQNPPPYAQQPQQSSWLPFSSQSGNEPPPPPRRASYMSGPPMNYRDGDFYDRNAFVRKVTMIVFIMLCMTAGFVAAVLIVDDIRLFFQKYKKIFLIVTSIGMVVMSVAMPTSSCARRSPTNYICLLIALILESLFCATVTCMYRTQIVVQALLITIVVVGLCVILACTSFDFTKLILYVVAIGTALCVLTLIVLISMFVFHIYSKPLMIVILVALTLFSVVTLIMDLQMILGGKSVELSETDYALGAFMLYTSIIDIFIKIAMLLYVTD